MYIKLKIHNYCSRVKIWKYVKTQLEDFNETFVTSKSTQDSSGMTSRILVAQIDPDAT